MSESGNAVPGEKDVEMWAAMKSEGGRKIFADMRSLLSATEPVRSEIERSLSVSQHDSLQGAACVGMERACAIVKYLICGAVVA